jgi:protein-S-isoprenylcysteine O-methyltransferase Ste14
MMLRDIIRRAGGVLFAWRSYTFLLLVPLFALEVRHLARPWGSHRADEAWEIVCLAVALAGQAVRVITVAFVPKGTSGRNTASQKASSLNCTGLYSIVRNPLYIGNYLILAGITLLWQSWELVVVNSLLFAAVYLPIILVEEAFLLRQFGREYSDYAARVPRVLPSLRLWVPPGRLGNWRMVLRREHDSVLSIVVIFTVLTHIRDYFITGRFRGDKEWLIACAVVTAAWLVIKILKKTTRLLRNPDEPAPFDKEEADGPQINADKRSRT